MQVCHKKMDYMILLDYFQLCESVCKTIVTAICICRFVPAKNKG